jgi:hypothetical protein
MKISKRKSRYHIINEIDYYYDKYVYSWCSWHSLYLDRLNTISVLEHIPRKHQQKSRQR